MRIPRPIHPADAATVAALIRLAFTAQAVAADPPPSGQCVTEAHVTAHLAAGGAGMVIEHAGRPIASVLWKRDGDRPEAFYISRLAVDPAHRRQGLASALLTAAEAAARSANIRLLLLETRIVFTDNRALFAAAGFHETRTRAHPGYAHPTIVMLEKPLTESTHGMGGAGDRA
jgi:ribosomal-protein-alanine N-acetyltransferase